MNILLTNDDGIESEGLRALARRLGRDHRILVVAPDSERSACGHSISIMKPLKLAKTEVEGAFEAYAFGGTPVDCVKFVWAKRDFKIDLVLSGINRGSNLGTDTIYSGTVSAAREGAILEIPSIAVSDVNREHPEFEADAEFFAENLGFLMTLDFTNKCYNVNFPNCPLAERKGLVPCGTGIYIYDEKFDLKDGHYYLSGIPIRHANDQKRDTDYILENFVTVSPLLCEFSDEKSVSALKKKFAEAKR